MTKILNIEFTNVIKSEFLDNYRKGVLFTPNVDHLVKLQRNLEFYKAYLASDFCICDSRIVYWMSKLLNDPIKEVITGSDFFPAFCRYHQSNSDISIFLFGAMGDSANLAMENINKKVGRNIVISALSPSWGFESKNEEVQSILHQLSQSNANVLVVGLGAPKQEIWVYKNLEFLKTHFDMIMCLGATIDFEAGIQRRAPFFIGKFGLEWLFRLVMEPKRMWKRYLVDDLCFFGYFYKQLFGSYKNPFWYVKAD